MNKEQLQELLEKYYKGETNLQEDNILRIEVQKNKEFSDESDVFAFFENEAFVPGNLEDVIFEQIEVRISKRKKTRTRIIQFTSVAASIIIFFSLFLMKTEDAPKTQLSQDEQFLVLEQALTQVSYSLQPSDDEDLLVVFQDNNFEIVMN